MNFRPLCLSHFSPFDKNVGGVSLLPSFFSGDQWADRASLSLSLRTNARRPTNSTETQIQTGNLSHSRNQKVSKIDRFVDSKITLRQAHSRDLQRVYGSTDAMDRGGAVSVARIVGGLFSAFV